MGIRQLIERGRIDIVQPDLTRCGGLTTARRIAHMVEDYNIGLIPHAWSSDILTATTLQFLAYIKKAYFRRVQRQHRRYQPAAGEEPYHHERRLC